MEKKKTEINVMDYTFYVRKIANTYYATNDERKELVQEGMIGVFEASQSFDPAFETSFITYATYYIKKRMLDWIYTKKDTVRLPANIHRAMAKYNAISEPNTADLSEFKKYELQHIKSGWNNHLKSLDEPLNDESETTLAEQIANDPESTIDDDILKMNKAITKLKPDHQQLLQMYYGLNETEPHTYQSIADIRGVSKEYIRQQILKAENKLKELMTI